MLNRNDLKYLFDELNNIEGYCVYKGIEHLDEDLSGDRGDVDIVVSRSKYHEVCGILKKFGFLKVVSIRDKELFVSAFNSQNGYLLIDLVVASSDQAFQSILACAEHRKYENVTIMSVIKSIETDCLLQKKNNFISLCKRKLKRFLGMAPYSVGKGILVVVVGTDGAGKTSLIKYINEMPFFKMIGVKSIYFGSNNFKLPFLKDIYEFSTKSRFLQPLKIIAAIAMQLERRMRIISALYYKSLGNVIVGDRYFYDDMVYQNRKENNSGKIKSLVIRLLKYTEATPDLVIYLDVDPEVAFNRKKDFDLHDMYSINRCYKDVMLNSGALFINANEDEESVRGVAVHHILKKLAIR